MIGALMSPNISAQKENKSAYCEIEITDDVEEWEGDLLDDTVPPFDPDLVATFGKKSAKVEVIKYFSLSCSGCLDFLEEDFPKIERAYIDRGKLLWHFKPLPADFLTVRAMALFEVSSAEDRREFMRTISDYVDDFNPHPSDTVLERYQLDKGIPPGLWIDKKGGNLASSQTVAESAELWKSEAFPHLYNFFVITNEKRRAYDVEPTKALIDKIMQSIS